MKQQIILTVDGMSCQGCADSIIKNLTMLDGVDVCHVDLANHQTNVVFDDGVVELSTIVGGIVELGFDVINNQ